VAYRIGENGSICVLYDSQSRASPSSDLDSTGSSASEEFIMDRVGRPFNDYHHHANGNEHQRHSTNSLLAASPANSPTKPMQQQMQDMVTDPRNGQQQSRMGYVPQNQLPPNYQMHPQQPPQPPHPQQAAAAAAFQYHRQAMNAANQHNNNHHPSSQHQYMQQVQWDGFGNNNKVLCG